MATLQECQDLAKKLGWVIRIKNEDLKYRVNDGHNWVFWVSDLEKLKTELTKYVRMRNKPQIRV